MKKIILISVSFLVAGLVHSQNPLSVGKAQLNFGVGLSGWGVPVYFGLDYGVSRDITVGGELSFRSYNEKWRSNRYRHGITGISANANFHFNRVLELPSKWDLYIGPNLGYYVWSSPNNYDGDNNSGIDLGAQIGTRYYLNNKVGLNLEFGGGNAFSGGKFGLTIQL
jgi:hypothetical protein